METIESNGSSSHEPAPFILLVDDEEAITSPLSDYLTRAGFEVAVAADGRTCLDLIEHKPPDLIVLDVVMPGMNGRQVLRHLRSEGDWVPVILLTRVGDPGERAMALEEGADDYLNKPFEPAELVARIRAVLRRASLERPPLAMASRLVSGPLSLDRNARRAYLNDEDLSLTPKAVTLLEYMLMHPLELLTRERLLDAVWGWDYPAGIRAVDTRIAELRRALGDDPDEPNFIETITGSGYRFIGEVEAGQ